MFYGFIMKILLPRKTDNCKIRFYSKRLTNEIYIQLLIIELDNDNFEIKEKLKNILANKNINKYLIGHGNIFIEINKQYKFKDVLQLIKLVATLF